MKQRRASASRWFFVAAMIGLGGALFAVTRIESLSPCCGGVECAVGGSNVVSPVGCDPSEERCAPCPSGWARVPGDCREAVSPDQVFSLRLASIHVGGDVGGDIRGSLQGAAATDPEPLRVCVTTSKGKACTRVGEKSPPLLVTAGEIVDPGIALTIDRGGAVVDERAGPLPNTPLMPSAICRGIVFKDMSRGRIAEVKLFLDPP